MSFTLKKKKHGISILSNGKVWNLKGVIADAGLDGSYLFNTLQWQSYDGFCATGLPSPVPTGSFCYDTESDHPFELKKDGVQLSIKDNDGLELSAVSEKISTMNGALMVFAGIPVSSEGYFDFPGNLPLYRYKMADLEVNKPICSWFYGTALHLWDGQKHINLLYRNHTEKWVAGGWKNSDGTLNLFFLAAAECRLKPSTVETFGNVTVQMPSGDPFKSIQKFVSNGSKMHNHSPQLYGPMYCCHPAGTTDTDYAAGLTFAQYSEQLPGLKKIGVRTIYVLPVYLHKEKRDIYSPMDLAIIDPRYGGEKEAKSFVQKAHRLGMKVIFDFVPHGPEPDSKLAQEHLDWCAVGQDGKLASEWNCVSFDCCNAEYLSYLKTIVKDYATNLGIDGMRVDCAMGGCANWKPYGNNRPSASSLAGGVAEIAKIREGFDEANKTALIMPEMTNPIPDYCHSTECFYNNTLYRVLMELNEKLFSDRVLYTQTLLRWLSEQHRSKPRGQVMGNWLENHDTVLWAGDAKRAEKIYGPGLTENMFRLISWIDGFPVLYQGDENPQQYQLEGRDLRPFFAETFSIREKMFPYNMEVEYLPSNSAVFAFRRFSKEKNYTVLLNLSDKEELWNLPISANILYGTDYQREEQSILLKKYGFAIIEEREDNQ